MRATLAVVALAALAACGGCGDDTPSVPPAQVVFGFNDNSVRDGQLTPRQDAELAGGAGAEVVRLALDWRLLEGERDEYEWDMYDGIYRALRERGMHPLWIAIFAPPWAWDEGVECRDNCRYPPREEALGQWEEMLELVARRYPESAGIELWNEPNLVTFWQPAPDPARYTVLLRRGYRAVKRARPQLPVVLGGLANRQQNDRGGASMADFLEAVYRHGGRGHMDAIAFHPYPQVRTDPVTTRSVVQVLNIRNRHGDGNTPLWITEFGATTSGSVASERWTEREQAATLMGAYEGLSRVPGVEMFLVHTLLDPPLEPASPEAGYGMVRPDGSPRPAYCAFARRLGGRSSRC